MSGLGNGRLYLWSLLVALALSGYANHIKETEDNDPKQHKELRDCNESMCPVKKKCQNDVKGDTSYSGWRLSSTCFDG